MPVVVIKTIVVMAVVIVLSITMGTMDMDKDIQTTVVNRALWQGVSRGWQSLKQLSVILKADIGESSWNFIVGYVSPRPHLSLRLGHFGQSKRHTQKMLCYGMVSSNFMYQCKD